MATGKRFDLILTTFAISEPCYNMRVTAMSIIHNNTQQTLAKKALKNNFVKRLSGQDFKF